MAGVCVIYLAFATLLTLCLGGKTFAALLGLVCDILICAAFVAIAVLDRSGANARTGNVGTPLGNGLASTTGAAGTNLGLAARLNTTSFACAIAGAVLMLLSFVMQLAMWRHHKKEKAFGPSPDNNYTSGSTKSKKRGLFARRKNNDIEQPFTTEKDATALAAVPAAGVTTSDRHAVRDTMRPSHDTAYTGTTFGQNDNAPSKYENTVPVPTTATYAQEPVPGSIVSTTHYTAPGRYDPTYTPGHNGTTGTTNANF